MPLETGTRINDLTVTNPTSSDPVGQGDDHLRLIKSVLVGTLPNMGNILGQVIRQDTAVSISSTWNTSHLVVSNSATATVVLTMPPAASITSGFYIDITTLAGATASIDGSGAETVNGAATAGIGSSRVSRVFYDNNVPGWRLVSFADLSGDNLSVAGTLSVSGATSLGSTLSVSGNTTLGGTLTVSAGVVLGSTLIGLGAARFDGTLSVSGATTLNALTVSGAATLASTLSVSGAATFKGAVSIAGAVTMAGALTVSGAATLAGTITVSGAATLKTTLSVGGNATLGGTLTVSAAAVLGSTLIGLGAATFGSTVTISGEATCKGKLSISGECAVGTGLFLNGGQCFFPAIQNPSASANCLDDYEEGTWTPTLTFATPGNLSVAYTTQSGQYTKIGRRVSVEAVIITSTFTHTTASGQLQITGLPFTVGSQSAAGAIGISTCSPGAEYQLGMYAGSGTTGLFFQVNRMDNSTTTTLGSGSVPSGTNNTYFVSATYDV